MSSQFDPITGYPIDTSPGTTTGFTYDPISGAVVDTEAGTPGAGWGMPGNFGTFLTDLQSGTSGLGAALKGIFGGKYGDVTQMAAFGGLAALLNRMMTQKPDPVGYQYGIPKYTATRTQTPMSEQRPTTMGADGKVIPYRPGQGGISYFSPMKYSYAGYEPKKAEDFLKAPAGLTPPPTGGTTGGTTDNTTPQYATDSDRQVAVGGGASGGLAELIVGAAGGSVNRYNMGGYSGGRYLRGPGDGVSDSIPAKFERSGQPARLADGEFVIDARTVSEIGNGSSEAGARKLYAMMDRVHKARKTAKRGKPSGADKYLPK